MAFERCQNLEDITLKIAKYEGWIELASSSSKRSPYDDTVMMVVELLDMVKVLAKEIQTLKEK